MAEEINVPEQVQEQLINVNGKAYPMNALPQEIKDLVNVYQVWEAELGNQRREVFKTEAALRALGSELELRFKKIEEDAKEAAGEATLDAANDSTVIKKPKVKK